MIVVKDPRHMSETQIEDKVVEWAKKVGFLAPKVKFAERGWPDRMFISPHGATIFIEFKRFGGKPDDLQVHRLTALYKRGIPCACCDSVFSAIRILQGALEPFTHDELGTTPIPKASDQAAAESGLSGTIFGPRLGQDQHSLSGPKGTEDAGAIPPGADRSAPTSIAEHVASRAEQMERIRSPDPHSDPRGEQSPPDGRTK